MREKGDMKVKVLHVGERVKKDALFDVQLTMPYAFRPDSLAT